MTPFVLMLVFGIGWIALMFWGESIKQSYDGYNNCEIIEEYVINANDSIPYDEVLSDYNIILPSETFNDSLTPTKKDTVMALKNLYNCD